MDRIQKLNLLKEMENRAFDKLGSADPGGDQFKEAMTAIHQSLETAERVAFGVSIDDIIDDLTSSRVISARTGEPISIAYPTAEEIPVKEATEYEAPNEAVDVNEPEKTWTMEEVKAKLVEAAKNGVKVNNIINDAGYAKLSQVPVDMYPQILKAAGVIE